MLRTAGFSLNTFMFRPRLLPKASERPAELCIRNSVCIHNECYSQPNLRIYILNRQASCRTALAVTPFPPLEPDKINVLVTCAEGALCASSAMSGCSLSCCTIPPKSEPIACLCIDIENLFSYSLYPAASTMKQWRLKKVF